MLYCLRKIYLGLLWKTQMSIYRIKSQENYPQNYQKENRESTEVEKNKDIPKHKNRKQHKIIELKLDMIITIINVNEINL